MTTCDLNCDMGEGLGNDAAIFPFITSANIACGYHAGDERTMNETVKLALQHNAAIGAHPSFADRQNFGRTEMPAIRPQQVYELVLEQVKALATIAGNQGAMLLHVKPHGALYNMAARDQTLAMAIAHAVYDFNPAPVLYGLSGSFLITEGKALGLRTASEVFADRTYQSDGSLTPRTKPNALIEDEAVSTAHALRMTGEGKVTAGTGEVTGLEAQTICLHDDGKNAVSIAQSIHEALMQSGVILKAI